MIKWHKNLYMDEKVSQNPTKYMDEVENDKLHIFPVYCVAIASNNQNLFDIIASNELMFRHYRRNCIEVVGLAHSYKEAVAIVVEIVKDAYSKTNGAGVNEWIRERYCTGD